MPDIDRGYAAGAAFQKHLGETARGGPKIKSFGAGRIEAEGIERGDQLQGGARNVFASGIVDRNFRVGRHLLPCLGSGLAVEAGRQADQVFHHTILEAADNELLVALSSSIAAAISWTTSFKQRRRKLPRDPLPDHREVYAAIADGNPEDARKAMVTLIELALQDTRESL